MTKIIIQLSNGNYVCYDLIATKFKSCAIVFNSYKYCLEFINLIENSGPLLYEDEDFICAELNSSSTDCYRKLTIKQIKKMNDLHKN